MNIIYNILTVIWIGSLIGAFICAFQGDGSYKLPLAVMWLAILLRCVVAIEM